MGVILVSGAGCQRQNSARRSELPKTPAAILKPLPENVSPQLKQLVESAVDQTTVTTGYDPAYVAIDYPGGDVPP